MDEPTASIISLLAEVSRFARAGDYANAALKVNHFLLRAQDRLSAMSANESMRPSASRIAFSLETMLFKLEQNDWVAIADIIDYELVPLWEKAFSPPTSP